MKKRILVFFALTIFALSVGGCSKINAFLTPQEVQHHEHSGGTATCLKKAKCDTCGEYYGIKAEHDYKEATCTSPKVCTVCRNISGVALGHVFSDATCTAPSQCERCNLVNSAATGHSFEEWQLIKSPTCTENGEQSRACACGEVQTNVLKSTGHSPTDWTVVKDATCTDDGIKKSICTLCGEYEEKTIKAAGHKYGTWNTTQEATYFETGAKIRYCSCGASEECVIPRLNKLFEDDFNGNILNLTKWEKCPEWDRQGGNSKWDNDMSYLDGNGHLVIRAEWDEENDQVICGGVRTEGLFEGGYGYYEASIKFSVAEGVWGAFWIQCGDINNVDGSAADGVEIDIVESIHNENGVFNSALHYDGYGNDHVQIHSGYLNTVDIYDGNFHTFAVERTSEGYIFYVDGIETWRVTSDTCDPCPRMGYIKLTIEAAEWAGSGSQECKDALPIEMLVDYVKVYPENPYK